MFNDGYYYIFFDALEHIHISSRGTKKRQFLNSDEEKPVLPEESHSMGTFLAFFGLYWLFFVCLF